MYVCIYIYIYIWPPGRLAAWLLLSGRNRFGSTRFGSGLFENSSVRLVSVPDFSKIHRFDSVRFGQFIFPDRRGSACVFRTRSGSVWFGSVQCRVRFRPVPELNGSVRFGSAGSVRFPIPSCLLRCVDAIFFFLMLHLLRIISQILPTCFVDAYIHRFVDCSRFIKGGVQWKQGVVIYMMLYTRFII